jgi:hypothetical protein
MKTYEEVAETLEGRRIVWTIGDNSATNGRYLNTHNKEIEAAVGDDYMSHPLYYVQAHVYTKKQRDELLKLIIDWNNLKPE